jgi:hypothetical protein
MKYAVIVATALTGGLSLSFSASAQTPPSAQTAAPSQAAPAAQPAPNPPAPAQSAPPDSAAPAAGSRAPAAAPAEAHPDLSGTWKLDPSISADPAKATFDQAQNRTAPRYNGGFGGGGFGGRRSRGGIGAPRPSRDSANDGTPDERAKRQAVVDEIHKGLRTLVISHHEPQVVVNDAADHTQFLQTDDNTADQQIGAQTIPTASHWEGQRLVTEYTLSNRQKVVFTYNLLAASRQLVLRVRLDDVENRRVVAQELKFVYTLAPAATK